MKKAVVLTAGAAAVVLLVGGARIASRKTPGNSSSEIGIAAHVRDGSSLTEQSRGDASKPSKPAAPFHTEWSPVLAGLALMSDEPRRAEEMAKLVAGISEANLLQAIDFFRKSPPADLAAEIASGLLRRLAAIDPAAAAASAESLPACPERLRALNDVAVVWSNLDLAKATEWVNGWPNPEERTAGMITLGYEAARTESVTALNLAVDLPASAERDALIDHAAAQWAAREPEKAAEWARRISDTTLRAGTLARIAVEWAVSDPAKAATVAISELPAGMLQNDTVISIVQRWAQSDPEAAGAWIRQFPEGRLKQTALKNLTALGQR